MADVGRMDISRFENGENVTMKTFLKIVNALPNLTELDLGAVRLKTGAAPDSRDQLRARAAELLAGIPVSGAAPRPEPIPQDEAAARREQSLIRMFAELLLEITGGSRDR